MIVLAWLRYRLTELTLIAVLAVLAVHLNPGFWVAVALVALACGRQEWRTHRIPTVPGGVHEDTDESSEEVRSEHG